MLIASAIITVLSIVVLFRFTSFDSSVLLKSLAYEIAASVREAQVYSLSVLGAVGEFRTPYGVSFEPDSQEYVLFRYGNLDFNADPRYDTSAPHNATVVQEYTLGRSLRVIDVCITTTDGEVCNSDNTTEITRLDIAFKRPEFRSVYYVADLPSGTDLEDIQAVRIRLGTDMDSEVWSVTVGVLGYISVEYEG